MATRLAAPRLREKRVVLDRFLRSAGLSVSQINKKDAVLPFGSGNRRRPRLPIDDGELACDFPGPENGQDPLFALRRSYDDFEKALFEATVAGILGSKKGVTGTEVTRFGARKQSSRQHIRNGDLQDGFTARDVHAASPRSRSGYSVRCMLVSPISAEASLTMA